MGCLPLLARDEDGARGRVLRLHRDGRHGGAKVHLCGLMLIFAMAVGLRRPTPGDWHRAGATAAAPSSERAARGTRRIVVDTDSPSKYDYAGAPSLTSSRRSAASTPPRWMEIPESLSPLSTPASVPRSIRSLKSPRCPMRNILPLTFPSPDSPGWETMGEFHLKSQIAVE